MKVMSMLDIDMSQTFFIEKNPERKNIRYCVQYVENSTEIIEIFDSVLNELIEKRENSSRRLIYSQTRNQCATINNAFCSQLEDIPPNCYMTKNKCKTLHSCHNVGTHLPPAR